VAPCSQASQSGLWMNPGKGLGAGERLRRSGADLRGVWGMALGASGHQTCIVRQTNTRATRRSWSNNKCGAMMRSSCTGMKEDHYTAVIRSRIIRRLRVQDPMVGVAHPTLSGFDMMFRGGSFTRL